MVARLGAGHPRLLLRESPATTRGVIAYAAAGGDLLKPLYESLFPGPYGMALGEYYTPDWLAEHVLDQVGYQASPTPA